MIAPPVKKLLFAGAVIILVAAAIFLTYRFDLPARIGQVVNEETSAGLFLVLMTVLPIFGFPISIFLVLCGAKFGVVGGLATVAFTFPIHMAVSWLLSHSPPRFKLESLLAGWNYRLPRVPRRKAVFFTIIFIGVPGIPYAPKNYLAAMSGVPARYYFGLGLPVHYLMAAPFVILGRSAAEADPRLFLAAAAVLLAVYFGAARLKERFRKAQKDEVAPRNERH